MEILQARILEWVSHSILRRIIPTQGLNLGLLPCRLILYQLSHQGSLNYEYFRQRRTPSCPSLDTSRAV